MSMVNVTNMVVLDNPTSYLNPFQFEITFDALIPLPLDLDWKVTYVSSAEDSTLDQLLDEVSVGPIPLGTNKFVLQADPPDASRIPQSDVLGVTVVLVTCSYNNQEFCRVGYYVYNEYELQETDKESGEVLPVQGPIDLSKVTRQILADKPRVTRFPIDWSDGTQALVVPGSEVAQAQQQSADINSSHMMTPPPAPPNLASSDVSSNTSGDLEDSPMTMERGEDLGGMMME